MKLINPDRYQHLLSDAQNADFSGWDFQWLDGRMVQDDPPWDYPSIVREHLPKTNVLLDMGTGGGELLASLAPLPPETHATESYPPNQAIAQNRLAALNVTLHSTREGDPLPFDNAYIDLVINRHDSFDASDVFRVLKPGGVFITQQVGGLDNLELNQILEENLTFPHIQTSLASDLIGLYEAGFRVERAEKAAIPSIFRDIGAVVYYLKAISWQVPGFSPETHAQGLIKIHNIIERQGQFVATAHRYFIIAKK